MTEKNRILIVDDSPSDLQMIASCLKNHYQVIAATNGRDALELLKQTKVEVVLLDVTMPDMDGYQVCATIRSQNSHIKIIFISANDGMDEILKGYDVGGNDYITKPFSPEILLSKIEKAVQFFRNYKNIESEKNSASDAFMLAINSMGELGGVINFLRNCFHISRTDELASLLMDSISNYELSGCIQLRSEFGNQNFSNLKEVTAIEAELLARIAQMPDRFIEKDKRMFINYPKVSVLIKNMPVTDEVKMGSLRDTLAILIESTNEKQLSIEKDQTILKQLESSLEMNINVLKETMDSLLFVKNLHQEIKVSTLSLIDQTSDEIQSTFINLGLTEPQEGKITDILKVSERKAEALFNESAELDEQVNSILAKLEMCHSKR